MGFYDSSMARALAGVRQAQCSPACVGGGNKEQELFFRVAKIIVFLCI